MYEIFIILGNMSFEYVICNLSASENIVSSSKGFNEVEGVLNDSRLDCSNDSRLDGNDAPLHRCRDTMHRPATFWNYPVFSHLFLYLKITHYL